MLNACVRMDAKPPTAVIKAAAKIDVLIIATAERRVKTAHFLENIAADEEGMALETMCFNVSARPTLVLLQIVPGIVVSTWNHNC